MESNLTTISGENIRLVADSAPQMFADCRSSHDRCLAAGEALLAKVQAAGGGLDETLDRECALYIERVKKTLKKMNDTRSPLTKMFDEFKSVFTAMENDVNVTKASTVPARVQALRNAFAAERRAEEERRRQEEYRRAQAESARKTFRTAVEGECRRFFDACVTAAVNGLDAIYTSATLDSWLESLAALKGYDCNLPSDWATRWSSELRLPMEIGKDECCRMIDDIRDGLEPQLKEKYAAEVESHRDALCDRMPSRKRELEAIEKADAEEAERRRAEMAAREAEEARRRDEERRAREAEDARRAEAARQSAEMEGLFGQAAADAQAYTPKTSVKKRINVLNPEGYSEIFSLWWAQAGRFMSMDELAKAFKTQVTYCEKMANDKANPVLLKSEHVEYVEEVKAK